jgi:hypothetical protein
MGDPSLDMRHMSCWRRLVDMIRRPSKLATTPDTAGHGGTNGDQRVDHDTGRTSPAQGRKTSEIVDARTPCPDGRQEPEDEVVAAHSRTSNALDLEANVSKLRNRTAVAASLKRSALRSSRRKALAISVGGIDAHLLHQSRRQGIELFTRW